MEYIQIDDTNIQLLNNVAVEVFDFDINPHFLGLYLKNRCNCLIVAVEDGKIVGQIRGVVHLQPDCASQLFVENLGITPVVKRQGIASKLMECLIHWGKSQGCEEFWLATENDNDEAIGFYRSQKLLETKVVMFANFADN